MTPMYMALVIIGVFFLGMLVGLWSNELPKYPPESHAECDLRLAKMCKKYRSEIHDLETEIDNLRQERP